MKVTRQKEVAALKVYHQYWDSYTIGDLETFASTLDEAFEMIGTSESEVAHNKTDGIAFYKAQMHEVVGKVEMRNRSIDTKPLNGMFLVNEDCDIYILTEREETFYSKLRLSTFLHETESGWKVIQQHGSLPDMRVQEGETLAFDKITKENLELRDAVKRRTIELENKSRELEIEASLERVRAVAMGMKKPGDMLGICRIISEQLQQFGVTQIRNIQTAIIDEEKGIYLCYQFFSSYNQEVVEKTEYLKSPVEHGMVRQMLASQNAYFTNRLSGEELRAFREHRKAENHFPDPLLDEVNELSYCFLSIGQGGLGLTLYQPLQETTLILFQRFHQVFSLAYQRFRDIELAEAQAREAQIEAALERVRARAMAMHTSGELVAVADVLREQMGLLNQPNLETSAIQVYHNDLESWDSWYAWRPSHDSEGKIKTGTAIFSRNSCEVTREMVRMFRSATTDYTLEMSGAKRDEWLEVLMKVAPELAENAITTETVIFDTTYFHFSDFHGGSLLTVSYLPPSEELKSLQRKAASVFDLAYRRFLDLQKAEAQAREAQVEAALERVRSQTMAMHNSEDVGKCIVRMLGELTALGVDEDTRFGIGILNHDNENNQLWTAKKDGEDVKMHIGNLDMASHPLLKSARKAWKEQVPLHQYVLEGEDLMDYYQMLNKAPDYKIQIPIEKLPEREIHYGFIFDHGFFYAFSPHEFQPDLIHITKRFSSLFEQTYRRYLDLVRAEGQAREAEIELALERVRARTMAMQNSDELPEAANNLFLQVQALGIPAWSCGYNILAVDTTSATCCMSSEGTLQKPFKLRLFGEASFTEMGRFLRSDETMLVQELGDKSLLAHYEYMKSFPDLKPTFDQIDALGLSLPTYQINHLCKFTHGFLLFITYEQETDAHDIFKRFAKVFEQTYTRFLDLQKAEAQAKEAQIEAALERIRSRTMAMQKSNELTDVAGLLFKQVTDMGISTWTAGFNVWSDDNNSYVDYITSPNGGFIEPYTVYTETAEALADISNARKSGVEFDVQYVEGEKIKQLYLALTKLDEKQYEIMLQDGVSFPSHQYEHFVFGSKVSLMFITYEPVPESHDIFKRFGKVFEQTYTRFLDLQKAEAQAREAQIEAALERVRSRTMAMQRSEELLDVASILFQQVKTLGVPQWNCGFNIWEIGDKEFIYYPGTPDGIISHSPCTIPLTEHPIFQQFDESRKRGDELLIYEKEGEMQRGHYQYMLSLSGVGDLLQSMLDAGFEFPKFQIDHVANFAFGNLIFITYKHFPEMHDVFKRFAKVFEQTYTRFLDLKKAEAQAREAEIQLALERVRARTMAMQKSNELADAAYVLFEQLNILGVTHERINIGIVNEGNDTIDFWVTEQGGEKLETKFSGRISEPTTLDKAYQAWKKGEKSLVVDLQGEELKSWLRFMNEEIKIPFNQAYLHSRRVQTAGFFSKGMLVVTSPEPLQDEAIYLLEKFAGVFDLTYTRFSDLQAAEAHALQSERDLIAIKEAMQKAENALTELKATQAQLIQKEKLASLGELTAGIAHEIQNPLNFINNFSEVNVELLQELNEEMDKGNLSEVRALISDLSDNERKIHHHGRRADAIVRGMMQHARTTPGERQPTDLNALADEYLRLAYHGVRAKDKSFNAELITDLDPQLGRVSVVAPDIGRVLLNLYNNAFYAVEQRRKLSEGAYSPKVWLTTQCSAGRVEVRVRDNGAGIPEAIREKIFQPFFTTKPTGEGTGLGLSLSYDIITKGHGGTLSIASVEHAHSEFVITFPASEL